MKTKDLALSIWKEYLLRGVDNILHPMRGLPSPNTFGEAVGKKVKDIRHYLLSLTVPLLIMILGLAIGHHRIFCSGFTEIQGDLGDVRFNNYLLEHYYRWATLDRNHCKLWDPPFFYPENNVGSYSDVLLSLEPFYAIWRVLGFLPDTSFQLWVISVSILNYLAIYLLLRKRIKLGVWAASAGSFLFAFGASRINQINHPQLLGQFYSIFVLNMLFCIFHQSSNTPKGRKTNINIFVLLMFVVAQLYGGFYQGWFLVFSLSLALLWSLCFKESREFLKYIIQRFYIAIVLSIIVAIFLLWPLVDHYLKAYKLFGRRDFEDVKRLLPSLRAWLNIGPHSWLYGSSTIGSYFQRVGSMEHEKRLGIGLITSLLCISGLLLNVRSFYIRIAMLTAFTLGIIATIYPGGFTLWKLIYLYIPGGGAVRAIGRIGFIFLIPYAIGFALLVDRFKIKLSFILIFIVLGVCALEQGLSGPSFNKYIARNVARTLGRQVDLSSNAFFYGSSLETRIPWIVQLDAMFAALECSKPTINGYSGNYPLEWCLFDVKESERTLPLWLQHKKMDLSQICWIKTPILGAEFVEQNIPHSLKPNETREVRLIFKNIGLIVWSRHGGFQLRNDSSTEWQISWVRPSSEVKTSDIEEYTFNIVSPSTPGQYLFKWRMYQNDNQWFGDASPETWITVGNSSETNRN